MWPRGYATGGSCSTACVHGSRAATSMLSLCRWCRGRARRHRAAARRNGAGPAASCNRFQAGSSSWRSCRHCKCWPDLEHWQAGGPGPKQPIATAPEGTADAGPGQQQAGGAGPNRHADSAGLEAALKQQQLQRQAEQAEPARPEQCWICLCRPEEGELTPPCRYARLCSHPHCLAHW